MLVAHETKPFADIKTATGVIGRLFHGVHSSIRPFLISRLNGGGSTY